MKIRCWLSEMYENWAKEFDWRQIACALRAPMHDLFARVPRVLGECLLGCNALEVLQHLCEQPRVSCTRSQHVSKSARNCKERNGCKFMPCVSEMLDNSCPRWAKCLIIQTFQNERIDCDRTVATGAQYVFETRTKHSAIFHARTKWLERTGPGVADSARRARICRALSRFLVWKLTENGSKNLLFGWLVLISKIIFN